MMNGFNGKTLHQLKGYLEDNFKVAIGCDSEADQAVKQMSLDSRMIGEGDVFIAIQGGQRHGLDFLDKVLTANPAVIISDRAIEKSELKMISAYKQTETQTPIAIWVIEDIANHLGELADWFYGHPSQQLKVVGITGTNGKTSTAFFTAQILQMLGKKVALMGTLGNGEIGNLQTTQNTTPDAIQVHRLLREFVEQGIQWTIMEVSSHALCLGRVAAVEFNAVALTQVTRDHMDFHGTEEAYQNAKMKLFTDYVAQHKVLNIADKTGLNIFKQLQATKEHCFTYDARWPVVKDHTSGLANLKLENALLSPRGIEGQIMLQGSVPLNVSFFTSLVGVFNIENLICALSILHVNGFELKELGEKVSKLEAVAGRMQVIHQQPTVIVDFAHTPDALQHVINAIQAHNQESKGELVTVFGCGGDRDKGKRALMGEVAEQNSGKVVITSDNPRSEDPLAIMKDISQGLKHPDRSQFEQDRKVAITETLKHAQSEDIILIAGKGHENYQEIQGVKDPYSDIEVVESWYKNRIE